MSSTNGSQIGLFDSDARRAYRHVCSALVAVGNLTDHVHEHRSPSNATMPDYQLAFLEERVRDELHDAKILLEEVLTHG